MATSVLFTYEAAYGGIYAHVSFDADPSDVSPELWDVRPTSGIGARVSVLEAVFLGGSYVYAASLHPPPSPGVNYTVTLYDDDGAVVESASAVVGSGLIDHLPDPPTYAKIAGLNNSFGRELSRLTGRVATSIYKEYSGSDSILFVRSTYSYPPSGEIHLDGRVGSYTDKTDGAFLGVVFDPPIGGVLPPGTPVFRADRAYTPDAERSNPRYLGQLQSTVNQTLVHKASGNELDQLSIMYGIRRPPSVPRDSWREALHAVALGPRGLPGGTLGFVEGVLKHFETAVDIVFDPGDLGTVALPNADGSASWVRRLVRTPYGLFRVIAADANSLTFCPVAAAGASGWESTGKWADLEAATTKSCSVLPFYLRERTPGQFLTEGPDLPAWLNPIAQVSHVDPNRAEYTDAYHQPGRNRYVEVCVWSDVVTGAPPTYLQMDEPDFYRDANGESTGIWPASPSVGDHLLVGSRGEFSGLDFTFDTPSDLVGTIVWEYFNNSGWSTLTVTDGTNGFTEDGAVTWEAPADWRPIHYAGAYSELLYCVRVRISAYTSDGGGEVLSTTLPGPILIRRPSGQPLGGALLGDEPAGGNQSTGPFPIYLTGPTALEEVSRQLKALLAAGIFCEFVVVDPPAA